MVQKLKSPLEEEIKEQEQNYYERLEKKLKEDCKENNKGFIDKKAVNEICCFKAVKKLHDISKKKK